MAKYIEIEAARDLLDMALEDDWEIEYANDRLDEIPAADVRPVMRGKWEVFDPDFNSYSCSACGEPFALNDGTPQENNMNFCPSCGADMREKS